MCTLRVFLKMLCELNLTSGSIQGGLGARGLSAFQKSWWESLSGELFCCTEEASLLLLTV